ncbi:MAG: hypothetical protein JRD68_16335 [Deltaproteobacteria bacterium]|nr:hypothetical protein [Deltaproteobacteria bacterium]
MTKTKHHYRLGLSPTAADKDGNDDKGKNVFIFIHIPALWNRPCPPTVAVKEAALI